MSKIKLEEMANKYHSELGSWIYTVEFGDGSDVQVSENYLEKYLAKKNINTKNGIRKDGGHPPGPKHKDDSRSWEPHAQNLSK